MANVKSLKVKSTMSCQKQYAAQIGQHGSTVAEHSPYHLKVEGLSPAACVGEILQKSMLSATALLNLFGG
jgi:hypothetical protein